MIIRYLYGSAILFSGCTFYGFVVNIMLQFIQVVGGGVFTKNLFHVFVTVSNFTF